MSSVPVTRDSLAVARREHNAVGQSERRTKGAWHKRHYNYFVVGNPAAFQALKPPAIERTFLYPIFCKLSAASAERPPPPQWQMINALVSGTFSSISSSIVPRLRCVAFGMCSSSHSSFSRTSTITASPLLDLADASDGETSVTFFLASATSFSKPL